MSKKALMGAAIALLAATACGSDGGSGTTADTSGGPEVVHVSMGALLPLTGSTAGFGEDARSGLDLWTELHGDPGGPVRFTIDVEDNRGAADEAITAYQKLRAQHDVQVIFSSLTTPTLAVMAQANDDGILVFNGGNGGALSQAGEFFFSTILNLNVSAKVIAGYAYEALDIRSVALAYRTDDYGAGGAGQFRDAFEALGGTVVADEVFAPETVDFQSVATSIVRSEPDAVFVLAFGQEIAGLTKALERQGYEGLYLSDTGMAQPEVLDLAGSLLDGRAYYPAEAWDPENPPTDAGTAFVAAYRDEYGRDPSISATRYFEAAEVVAGAANDLAASGREITGAALRQAILDVGDISTVAGSVRFFDGNQFATRDLVIQTIADGAHVTFAELDQATVSRFLGQ